MDMAEVTEITSKTENVAGQVKWFSAKKGFGFLVGPDGEDVFVHFSFIDMDGYKTLNKGDDVVYDLMETNRGLQAHAVRFPQL